MFVGLILFAIIAITLTVLLIKAVKGIFRLLTGGKKQEQDRKEDARTSKQKAAANRESETVAERARQEEGVSQEPEPLGEELEQRFAFSRSEGITESFWTEYSPLEIHEKNFADICTLGSQLTYLEFGNRSLAGEDFHGFNLLIEEDSRLVLTYSGQAVASITRVETTTSFQINGRTVEGTGPSYRINTFPPTLRPGLVPGDLVRMLEAVDRVKGAGGEPMMVANAMLSEFMDGENISKLKSSIDGKIQSNESSLRRNREQKPDKGPKRMTAKGN